MSSSSLPVKQSRSSANSGAGFFFCSCVHIFFIFLVREGRRACRDNASTPSLQPSFCNARKIKYKVQLIQQVTRKHHRVALLCTNLQVSALPREGALQSQVEPAGGRFLSAAVHRVQAGVASLLHQSRKAGGADGLLKFLDKLEEGPEGGGRRVSAQPWRHAPCHERRGEACQTSHRWVFSTDCLMDQKLTSFHLEILTKS